MTIAASTELRARMNQIEAIAPRLNGAADDSAGIIQMVEAFLKEKRIGVRAESREFRREETTDLHGHLGVADFYRLQFGRWQGEFAIHVLVEKTAVDSDGDPVEVLDRQQSRWSDLSRADKIKSMTVLASLLEEIGSNADAMLEDAMTAIESLDAMTRSLGLTGATDRPASLVG